MENEIKVGDKVCIRSKEWFLKNCKHENNKFFYDGDTQTFLDEQMLKFCGKTVTVLSIKKSFIRLAFYIEEDDSESKIKWSWKEWMIESEVEKRYRKLKGIYDKV